MRAGIGDILTAPVIRPKHILWTVIGVLLVQQLASALAGLTPPPLNRWMLDVMYANLYPLVLLGVDQWLAGSHSAGWLALVLFLAWYCLEAYVFLRLSRWLYARMAETRGNR